MLSELHQKPRTTNTLSKQRLAAISHHFLSEIDERSPIWKNTAVVPVLLSSRNDDHIVYELDRSFNRQQRSSMVLNIESQLMGSNALSSAVAGSAAAQTSDNSQLPDFCLIPVTSPTTTLALKCKRVVMVVHASLGGVRAAYNQLAFLASLETRFDVCVVMFGANTSKDARRFFNFLCNNAQSLLALKLECGGFLLEDEDGRYAAEQTAEGDTATDMDGVARGILGSFSPKRAPRPDGPQLAAPAGVAAYLS